MIFSQLAQPAHLQITSVHRDTPSIYQTGKQFCNLKKKSLVFDLEVRFQMHYLLKPTE